MKLRNISFLIAWVTFVCSIALSLFFLVLITIFVTQIPQDPNATGMELLGVSMLILIGGTTLVVAILEGIALFLWNKHQKIAIGSHVLALLGLGSFIIFFSQSFAGSQWLLLLLWPGIGILGSLMPAQETERSTL